MSTRQFIDGKPTAEMEELRDNVLRLLEPWRGIWESKAAREDLVRAAFESGWDHGVCAAEESEE